MTAVGPGAGEGQTKVSITIGVYYDCSGPGAGEGQTKVSITIAVYYDCSWPRCWRRTDKSVNNHRSVL